MELDQVKAILAAHQAELRALGVKSLSVFGSVARGEARPDSDVDLLVEFDRPTGLFKFVEVKEYLESILGRHVDLGTQQSLRPQLREKILAEAVRAS
ncbi:MAG: nucleotidyltransferase family protein [Chloroflexi bacterium]|nr:nucleotidyltransferase family protein [Chloroflexota bacterium]